MTEKQIERIKKLGLNVEDFEPRKQTTEEQLADLAEYVNILTDMVLGGAE